MRRRKDFKDNLKRFWRFIWHDDSIWSWIANALIAFVLIKFLVYPGLGFLLGTTHPIVAVVSGSMEHDGSFEDWWSVHEDYYTDLNITKEQFSEFPFHNGFNTGDIMVLYGKKPTDIELGDVIVYWGRKPEPIIHRVVDIDKDGGLDFQTKGDHNLRSDVSEIDIEERYLVGYSKYEKGSVAVIRIPFLGYIKIAFVSLVNTLKVALVNIV